MLPELLLSSWLCSAPHAVSELVQTMTLEEKVGQVLMVHFRGETANEKAKVLIQGAKVGGMIYYNWSNGLRNPEQIRTLSAALQVLAQESRLSIPLLIAADQEGGVVARCTEGFTQFPGNRALGETNDPDLAELAALATARELQAVGINMNLAPVVDVNSCPRNPVIGIRSFGQMPERVALFAQKTLSGFRQAGMISTLKHFPGHGDVEIDSHEDLPKLHKSKEDLEKVELFPFAQLSSQADAVMTAHLLVPALDEENCSTLSKKTLSYLRDTLKFPGVIVTDSLVMEGVLKKYGTVDETAIAALNAGCDLLILGGRLLAGERSGLELTVEDVQRIHQTLAAAVKTGRIAEERLNQAVEKVLQLKSRYLVSKVSSQPIESLAHLAIAQKIASSALKIIQKRSSNSLSLQGKKLFVLAPQFLQDPIGKTSLLRIGSSTDAYFFSSPTPLEEEMLPALQSAQASDLLIVCSYNTWKNSSARALIQSFLEIKKPFILLSLRDPLDTSLFPDADLTFTTFSPTALSIQAVCDELSAHYFTSGE
jgi:beta-N-acetylhexosaminidase